MNGSAGKDDRLQPSKSDLKRQARALRDLGERLVGMDPGQRADLPLPDDIRHCIEAAQGITQGGARKRELQYLGKLLRELSEEKLAGIREGLDRVADASRVEAARHHRLERWRDALIERGDELIFRLAEDWPGDERRRLRQLVLAARRESDAGKPPASARALFRRLRELDRQDPLPEAVFPAEE